MSRVFFSAKEISDIQNFTSTVHMEKKAEIHRVLLTKNNFLCIFLLVGKREGGGTFFVHGA